MPSESLKDRKMAADHYNKLKKEAHDLYVNQGISNKEIHERTGVSLKSVSGWVNENDGAWKKEREARLFSSKKQGDNVKEIISILADQKLKLLREIDQVVLNGDADRTLELRKQSNALDNSIAQWGNQLKEIDKSNRITLAVYLEVMDRVFDGLKVYSPELYHKTLDFQELHIYETTKLIG